jgi:hypothetical protein
MTFLQISEIDYIRDILQERLAAGDDHSGGAQKATLGRNALR